MTLLRFVALLLVVPPLAAQAAPRWQGQVTLGAARAIAENPLATGLYLSGAFGRALGSATTLSLEFSRMWLGSDVESGLRPGFPPYFRGGRFRTEASQGLWVAGLRLDQRLFRAPITPSLVLGLGTAGLTGGYESVLRDSVGTQVLSRYGTQGTYWGPDLSIGLTLGPATNGRLVPRLEARVHGALVRSEESWTSYQAFTVGLSVRW